MDWARERGGRSWTVLERLLLKYIWEIQEEVFNMQLKMWVCAQETLLGWSQEHSSDN